MLIISATYFFKMYLARHQGILENTTILTSIDFQNF